MTKREYKKWKRSNESKLANLLMNDHPWDYLFLLDLIEYKINQMYDYYVKTRKSREDTPLNGVIKNYDMIITQLAECKNIFRIINSEMCDRETEDLLYERLFKLISTYIRNWWD